MAMYFADQVVWISEEDRLSIDSILFGDVLHIPVVGTSILEAIVGDMKPTP